MSWPLSLPSVRQQWNMRSRGCLPQGNWNLFDSQGITFLGEDLYLWSFRGMVPGSRLGEVSALQLYRWVEGLGFERLSAGHVGHSPAWEYPGSGNLITDRIPWVWGDCHVVADDRYLYAFDASRWIRIDPTTLDWLVIAGAWPDFGEIPASVDAPVGADARFHSLTRRSVVHDGYLYMWDAAPTSQFGAGFARFRRMQLSHPYPVETLFSCSGTFEELSEEDPSTGLPYGLRGDKLYGSESIAFAIDGDFMYVLYYGGLGPGGYWPSDNLGYSNGNVAGLFRYPLADLSQWDLLYYGLDAAAQGSFPRDMTSGYSFNDPYISQGEAGIAAGFENPVWPGTGTPDLEGFQPTTASIAITDSRKLAFANAPVAFFASGFGAFGYTVCLFDLPSLESEVQFSGPMRHNRSAPFYETICNGTAGDESHVGWNASNRQRAWIYRSGSTPLIQHPNLASLTSKGDSVWFSTPVLTNFVGNIGSFQDWYSAHFVVELARAASTGAAIDVRLKFDGVELKAYSPQGVLERLDPPEEVQLT